MEQAQMTVQTPVQGEISNQPARDWSKLLIEARASGCSDADAVVFIADNTRDKRTNGGYNTFAKGYHAMIEAWMSKQAPRKSVTLTTNTPVDSQGLCWYRAALEVAAKSLEMSADTIRLHAGEMTAQEMRSVQAVLRWKAAEIRGKADEKGVLG